jgi:DNA-binding transcriptional LysR family regulator
MNLRQLEAFCRIIDLGSFSMAAEDMGLSQPAVTFQIQALEQELGITLLDRSPRRILPTDGGRILYRHAREILRHVEEARREIVDLDELLRGTLLIGASTGPGEHVLPQVLGRFKADYPQTNVVLRILPTDEIISQVLNYDLEVGVVGARESHPKLHFEPFVQDRLTVIAPADHPWASGETVTVEELLREPLILQQVGAGVRTMLEAGLQGMGLSLADLNVHMEAGLQESIKTAVEAGFGIGIISRFAVRQELRFGTLAEVDVADLPSFRDEFYLVRNRRRKLSRLTETFLSFAKEQVETLTT